MKILTIPDIHGNHFFLRKIERLTNGFSTVDKVVFLGDYFDSRDEQFQFESSLMDVSDRLNSLYDFLGDRAIFLMGNHEIAYVPEKWGVRKYAVTNAFYNAYGYGNWDAFDNLKFINELKPFYKEGSFLFSHAGVRAPIVPIIGDIADKTIFEIVTDSTMPLNKKNNLVYNIFGVGGFRGGSYLEIGGPLWIDYEGEFLKSEKNEPEGLFQLMGHTKIDGKTRSSFGSLGLDAGQKAFAIVDTETNEIEVFVHGEHLFYQQPESPFKIKISNV